MKGKIILFGITSFAFVSCLISCEYEAQLSYKIQNNSTANITVICTNTNGKVTTDTFKINLNEGRIIAVNGQGINRVSNYKETGDSLRDFTRINIFKNDTLQSLANFLKTNSWTYDEKDQ